MFAYEAYGKREDLYETHMNSDAMGVFLSKIPSTMTTGLDLTNYEDVVGFLDRDKDMKECAAIWDTRLWLQGKSREAILKRLAELASWIEKNEPETYTFLVHKGLDNADEVRILERYATREALDRYQTSQRLVEFYHSSREMIKSMEGHGYVPNGLGWLHR